MKSTLSNILAIALLGFEGVSAQGAAWAQCGGIGWTGPTTCVSGYYCSVGNPYYSQCIPGSGSGSGSTTTTPALSTTLRTSATTSSSQPTQSPSGGIKYWFSFGDSYTSTGFSATGTQPSAQRPLGNPNYPGQTTSNGPNWIDVVTVKYNKALTYTYNLAISGASIDNSILNANNVPSMTDQFNTWNSRYANKPSTAPWQSGNTMFSAFIGINDIGGSWSRSDINSFIDTLLTAEFKLFDRIYNAGGRNFLFHNIPPMERAPIVAGNANWATKEKAAVTTWNSKLQTYISNFKNSHPGVTTFFVDTHAQFTMVLNNPTAYGLSTDLRSSGNNQQLFWSDGYHPNTVMHDILGKEVARVVQAGGFW